MTDIYKRWRVPFIGRGARGLSGGHVTIFGVRYGFVLDQAWGKRELQIGPFFAIERYNDGEWRWALGKLEIKFCRASHRYLEREKKAQWRKARTQLKSIGIKP